LNFGFIDKKLMAVCMVCASLGHTVYISLLQVFKNTLDYCKLQDDCWYDTSFLTWSYT